MRKGRGGNYLRYGSEEGVRKKRMVKTLGKRMKRK